MKVITQSKMIREFNSPYYEKLNEHFLSDDFKLSGALDKQKIFSDANCQGNADPMISFVFDNRDAEDISWIDRMDFARFIGHLYAGTSVKLYPVALSVTNGKKVELTVSCGELVVNMAGYGKGKKSTVNEKHNDLRNLFKTSTYQGFFEQYGITSIEFKNFPLPFKSDHPKAIQYINAGNTPCP